jgi:lipopolysaccharide transport system ATP-binding protein
MFSDVAIAARGLGKCYQIYDKPHHRLAQMFLRGQKQFYREFWALQDVNLEIYKGEVVGILGKNGAGKSTLLQMICGTVAPTLGEVEVQGRVAALLELGAGFNPEFSGIENVYMNGQILGLSREEIDNNLDAIKSFADIGDFIHQPVKTYSSGMFARLAFSVAVHVSPDILIVDEALSVGDSWFQHKSMAKMKSLMSNGCTVVFVSHAIDSVRALCGRAIWLEHGRVRMQDHVTTVTNAYMNDVFIEHNRIVLDSKAEVPKLEQLPAVSESGAPMVPVENNSEKQNIASAASNADGGVVLDVVAVSILNEREEVVEKLGQGEKFKIRISVNFYQAVQNVSVGFLIKDQFGQELTGESVFNTFRHSLSFAAGQTVHFVFASQMCLRGGQSYSVSVRINHVSKWDRSDNVLVYANDIAAVVDVIADVENPMWFMFRQHFSVEVLDA